MFTALCAADFLNIGILSTAVDNWWRYDSVFAFVASISLFLAFLNTDFKNGTVLSKIAVKLSGATFGVYLIHAHADICINKWWQMIGMTSNLDAWWFVFYQILTVFAIFLVCALADIVRQWLFRVIRIQKLIDFVCCKAESKIRKLIK